MIKRKALGIATAFLCMVQFASGQQVQSSAQEPYLLPEHFDQFDQSVSIYHPASIGIFNKVRMSVLSRIYSGPFTSFNTVWTHASYSFDEAKGRPRQTISASFYNESDGEFINKTWGWGHYAIHLDIQNGWKAGAGISFGVLNYSVTGRGLDFSGSDFSPDGNAGIAIQKKGFVGYLSANQLFNAVLRPLEASSIISRHYNIGARYDKEVHPDHLLRGFTNVRLYNGVETLAFSLRDTYRRVFTGGIGYVHLKGASVFLGLENLTLDQGEFGAFEFLFSYSWPFAQYRLSSIRTIEIVINYTFNEKTGVTY